MSTSESNPSTGAPSGVKNSVTLFQAGSVSIVQEHSLPAGAQQIVLPVREARLDQVVSSLQVFGDGVSLAALPTFRTPGATDLDSGFDFSGQDCLSSLALQLRGAKVKIGDQEGSIVGIEKRDEDERVVVISTADGLRLHEIKPGLKLKLTDERVQKMVDDALARSIKRLNPGTTEVGLALESADDGGKAYLQYAQESAAWTLVYNLRERDGAFVLEASAVVHNSTAENWEGVDVTLSTGSPIDFTPLVTEAFIPDRQDVDFIPRQTAGHMAVQDTAMGMAEIDSVESFGLEAESVGRSPMRARSMGLAAAAPMAAGGALESADSAFESTVDIAGVGDHVEYSSQEPLDLGAGESAIIPVLTGEVEAEQVLLFNAREGNHPRAAIRLTNSFGQALARGSVTVYREGGRLGGRSELRSAQPGETRILPFAVENRVKVTAGTPQTETADFSIEIAQGTLLRRVRSTTMTEYVVANTSDDSFSLVIDHQLRSQDPEIHVSRIEDWTVEKIDGGARITVDVAPSSEGAMRFTVQEVKITDYEMVVDEHTRDLNRFFHGIAIDHPLRGLDELKGVIALQQQIEDKGREVGAAQNDARQAEQQRARALEAMNALPDGDAKSGQEGKFTDAETRLEQAETKQGELQQALEELAIQLRDALRELAVSWSNDTVAARSAAS